MYQEMNTKAMPSRKRLFTAVTLGIVGIGLFSYSVIILQRLRLGTGLGVAFLVVAAFAYYEDADRKTLTRAMMVITLIYGVFTFQFVVAVVAACVVYLTAWLTGPDSPLDAPDTRILPVEAATPEEPVADE